MSLTEKATHRQTRLQNERLVLKTVYHGQEISRAQIARLTHLTRPTVSDLVADLMAQGLVIEVGHGPSTGGKPPMLLSVDEDARHIVGVDLSRWDFRGAIINLHGHIDHREHRPLRERNGQGALKLVYELLDGLMNQTDRPILGIGVGTPGLIDAVDGVIVQAVNLDWRDVPLCALLEERYGVPVYLANDCQAAAVGEYTFSNSEGVQDLVVISVEWGIGAGIVINGELLHGNPLGAGEIGHVRVSDNGIRCSCGNVGCLETVAKGEAIVRRTQELLSTESDTALPQPSDRLNFPAVCEMAHQSHPAAEQAIHEAAEGLGIVAANLVAILGSCHIRFTGELNCLGEAFLDQVETEMTRRTLTALAKSSRCEFATLGNDIVLLGAAAMILTQELGVY